MNTIPFLLILALVVWYWQINLKGREHAIRQCKLICRDMNLQLLDETVVLASLSVRRATKRPFQVVRKYRFETSPDGMNRYNGYMVLHGLKLQYAEFNLPDGTILMDRDSRQIH